jgi:hypothetical protein
MSHFASHAWRATFSAVAALILSGALVQGVHAEGALRAEIGKPLQAAKDLIKAQKYREALAKVKEADAAGGKSPAESYVIERMRIAAASGAGDLAAATASFEALSASGRLSQAEKLQFIESLAGSAYRAKDYAKTTQWGQRHAKEGGSSASIRALLVQSQYLTGDYAGVARQITADVQASEKAGGRPSEDQLKLLLNAASKINDTDRYAYTVEKLLTYYPKKEYWADVLSRLQTKPNFSEKFALDTYRLALATGSLRGANDYIEYAQLAAQAGFPAEGKQVVEKGYAAGLLGTGASADRHKRLQDLLAKRSEEDKAARSANEAQALASADGNALVKLGYNVALGGDSSKGLNLMQQGIDKGGASEANKLRYGIAQVLNGQAGKAGATFKSVGGKDGAAELARLWSVYARSKSGSA